LHTTHHIIKELKVIKIPDYKPTVGEAGKSVQIPGPVQEPINILDK
jgi:hypothetical protein